MSLVALLDLADLDGPARQVAESGEAQYGSLLETWRALFNRPEIFAAYLPLVRAVAGPGTVDTKLKDLSALLVGARNNCRYTVSHRTAAARRSGATDAELVGVVQGEWSVFDALTRAVLELTVAMTEQPAQVAWRDRPQLVDPDLLAKMAEHFTDAQLVELTFSIAMWNALARFHRIMGFELDMPEPPAAIDPAQRSTATH